MLQFNRDFILHFLRYFFFQFLSIFEGLFQELLYRLTLLVPHLVLVPK
mgnify:CR=1 FL=1